MKRSKCRDTKRDYLHIDPAFRRFYAASTWKKLAWNRIRAVCPPTRVPRISFCDHEIAAKLCSIRSDENRASACTAVARFVLAVVALRETRNAAGKWYEEKGEPFEVTEIDLFAIAVVES